jgi:hypothetical protein
VEHSPFQGDPLRFNELHTTSFMLLINRSRGTTVGSQSYVNTVISMAQVIALANQKGGV